jgi:hypothetical protein
MQGVAMALLHLGRCEEMQESFLNVWKHHEIYIGEERLQMTMDYWDDSSLVLDKRVFPGDGVLFGQQAAFTRPAGKHLIRESLRFREQDAAVLHLEDMNMQGERRERV